MNITNEELKRKIQDLKGMAVGLAWKGYGSAIFLELGALTKEDNYRSQHAKGEACLWLEWDWRAEKNGMILFGSSNSRTEISDGINCFVGKKIEEIKVTDEIPELTIIFSDGYKIQTMAMVSGDPQWTIRLKNSNYLSYENMHFIERAGNEVSAEIIEDTEYIDLIDKIVDKIGKPLEEPIAGNCYDCKFFFRIDGDYALLEYGACCNEISKLYQHLVKTDSGCTVFLKDE